MIDERVKIKLDIIDITLKRYGETVYSVSSAQEVENYTQGDRNIGWFPNSGKLVKFAGITPFSQRDGKGAKVMRIECQCQGEY